MPVQITSDYISIYDASFNNLCTCFMHKWFQISYHLSRLSGLLKIILTNVSCFYNDNYFLMLPVELQMACPVLIIVFFKMYVNLFIAL